MSGERMRNRYAIVGVGETEYSRNSGRTTRAMGVEAIRNAMTDAGLEAGDTSWGIMSYSSGTDSTPSPHITADLGIRPDYYMDVLGGGSSTEALIGIATGVIEAGMCETVIIYRSMNGFTEARVGGTGRQAPSFTVNKGGETLALAIYGLSTPLQNFSMQFVRHMHEFGTTSEQLAHVKVAHSKHASNNPKAYYKQRLTVDDVLNSRYIVKPFHLLDCCVETDNATAIIVTSTERARDLAKPVTSIMGVAGRASKMAWDYHWCYGPVTEVGAHYAAPILWRNSGVGPEDIDLTGSYDAFTFTTLLQLEAYGFCKQGEGGGYVSSGSIELGGARPNNTSGGHLCEGYTHGMNMVIENVRQLRGQADDSCPNWQSGEHSYDYSEGRCRQVRDPQISANLGWSKAAGSAVVLTNQA